MSETTFKGDFPPDIQRTASAHEDMLRHGHYSNAYAAIAEAIRAERGRIAEWAEVLADEHDASAVIASEEAATVEHRAIERAFRDFAAAIRIPPIPKRTEP